MTGLRVNPRRAWGLPLDDVPPALWGSNVDPHYDYPALSPRRQEVRRLMEANAGTTPLIYSPRGKRDGFWQALGACVKAPNFYN